VTTCEIVDFIEDHIYVLDYCRRVKSANHSARIWMAANGIFENEPDFFTVLAKLGPPNEMGGDGQMEVYVSNIPRHAVFQMRERPVFENDAIISGYFVTLTDVTRYRALIDEMETLAGIDPLTGLGNRYRYVKRCEELDVSGAMLSVLVGDVNELKYINDSYGHEVGDRLLQKCAGVLKTVLSSHGEVFRFGGDEFVALLPGVDLDTARLLAALFEAHLTTVTGLPRPPSVAVGVAQRESSRQPIEEVIKIADMSMYACKKNDRRGRANEEEPVLEKPLEDEGRFPA
jgi:diguanylate cyclase (GGDEF)-like protein